METPHSKALKSFVKASTAHKAGAPYKTAMDAIKSKTFTQMHSTRRALEKINRMSKIKP